MVTAPVCLQQHELMLEKLAVYLSALWTAISVDEGSKLGSVRALCSASKHGDEEGGFAVAANVGQEDGEVQATDVS